MANHASSPTVDYRCDGVETPANVGIPPQSAQDAGGVCPLTSSIFPFSHVLLELSFEIHRSTEEEVLFSCTRRWFVYTSRTRRGVCVEMCIKKYKNR